MTLRWRVHRGKLPALNRDTTPGAGVATSATQPGGFWLGSPHVGHTLWDSLFGTVGQPLWYYVLQWVTQVSATGSLATRVGDLLR